MKIPNNRRSFLKKVVISGAASFSIMEIVKASTDKMQKSKRIKLIGNETILFQGDSITDAGRDRENMEVNSSSAMGNGYAFIASSELLYDFPGSDLKFYNKGISGNKVYQLAERWEKDCLELKPDILSILIGVNDYWHMAKHGYEGTIETYKTDLDNLLRQTKEELPESELIIGEPFALPGISAVDESWFPTFDQYRKAAQDLADEYEAHFIPYQSIFEEASKKAPAKYWTFDGVHPSLAGSQLMAAAWLEVVG